MSEGPEFQLPDVARAFRHIVRVEILTTLLHRDEICAREIADRTGSSMALVTYHFRYLQEMEMVEPGETVLRDGELEQYYFLREGARKALRPASDRG